MTRITIDVLLHPEDLDRALRTDVRQGLTSEPKTLPPKWFYDDRGCELFDEITRLPEYYPTETERAILHEHADEIARASGADTIVELGSGTSDKTRTLLDAFSRSDQLTRFSALEVNELTLRDAAATISAAYPGLSVHGVVGDFEHHLPNLPSDGRRMITFLGSTIGNFAPPERKRFLTDLAQVMAPGDSLLLGTDLVKAVDRLEAAYDDSQGVTAAFNRNVLAVMNRKVGSDFDIDSFDHMARFDRDNEWIEMLLRSTRDQQVHIRDLDLTVTFGRGELLRTEISAKFRRDRLTAELGDAGLRVARWMTDDHEDFALTLAIRDA